MIESFYDRLKSYATFLKPYLWPYVLIPVIILYSLDFIILMLHTVEWILIAALTLYGVAFLIGMFGGVLSIAPGTDYSTLINLRIVDKVPPLKWGYLMVTWLFEDLNAPDEPEPSAEPDIPVPPEPSSEKPTIVDDEDLEDELSSEDFEPEEDEDADGE